MNLQTDIAFFSLLHNNKCGSIDTTKREKLGTFSVVKNNFTLLNKIYKYVGELQGQLKARLNGLIFHYSLGIKSKWMLLKEGFK